MDTQYQLLYPVSTYVVWSSETPLVHVVLMKVAAVVLHTSFYLLLTQEVLEEIVKFRIALRKYYNSKEQSCVIFERNFKSQHLQLQVCYH